jgi:hypothetical protein
MTTAILTSAFAILKCGRKGKGEDAMLTITLTITLLLVLAAFLVTIAHAIGKAPLWPAVLLLVLVELLRVVPLR